MYNDILYRDKLILVNRIDSGILITGKKNVKNRKKTIIPFGFGVHDKNVIFTTN